MKIQSSIQKADLKQNFIITNIIRKQLILTKLYVLIFVYLNIVRTKLF